MARRICVVLGSLLMCILALLPATALEVEHLYKPFARGDARTLRVEVPVGELTLERHRNRSLDVELMLDCSGKLAPCRERAEMVRLDSKHEGAVQVLGFSGPDRYGKRTRVWFSWSSVAWRTNREGKKVLKTKSNSIATLGWKLSADLDVSYPDYDALEVFLGEGSVTASKLRSDTKIQVGKGEVLLKISRLDVKSVTMEVGRKASARLMVAGQRALKGRKIEWAEGEGKVEIVVHLDRGSAIVQVN